MWKSINAHNDPGKSEACVRFDPRTGYARNLMKRLEVRIVQGDGHALQGGFPPT